MRIFYLSLYRYKLMLYFIGMEIDLRKSEILNETNPFILELKGKMYLQPRANTIVAKGEEIVDTITGEVLSDDVLVGRRKVVDKSQFAKIYASEISILFDLSKTAINVLLYLTRVMDFENKAYINTEQPEKVGYKTSTSIRKGLKELIRKDIIAPAFAPGWYWLNPTIICKGERFGIYTEYVTQERHQRDLARTTKNKMLSEQGKYWYDSLDDETQNKLEMMNEQEERKYVKNLFSEQMDNPYTLPKEE